MDSNHRVHHPIWLACIVSQYVICCSRNHYCSTLHCARREDMTSDRWGISYSAVLVLFIACATTISAAPMPSAAAGNAQITVLYDAFGKASTMKKDWGYAALVEYGGKRILFDTG